MNGTGNSKLSRHDLSGGNKPRYYWLTRLNRKKKKLREISRHDSEFRAQTPFPVWNCEIKIYSEVRSVSNQQVQQHRKKLVNSKPESELWANAIPDLHEHDKHHRLMHSRDHHPNEKKRKTILAIRFGKLSCIISPGRKVKPRKNDLAKTVNI